MAAEMPQRADDWDVEREETVRTSEDDENHVAATHRQGEVIFERKKLTHFSSVAELEPPRAETFRVEPERIFCWPPPAALFWQAKKESLGLVLNMT